MDSIIIFGTFFGEHFCQIHRITAHADNFVPKSILFNLVWHAALYEEDTLAQGVPNLRLDRLSSELPTLSCRSSAMSYDDQENVGAPNFGRLRSLQFRIILLSTIRSILQQMPQYAMVEMASAHCSRSGQSIAVCIVL